MKLVGIFGYAAGKIAGSLKTKGGTLILSPEAFFVKGKEGPLKEGELERAAEGRTNREIADLLSVSVKTVLGHRTSVMEKLNIHNRTELIKYAIRKKLISVDI
jgi:DNA-binding CsgD family transcriptional regulator